MVDAHRIAMYRQRQAHDAAYRIWALGATNLRPEAVNKLVSQYVAGELTLPDLEMFLVMEAVR